MPVAVWIPETGQRSTETGRKGQQNRSLDLLPVRLAVQNILAAFASFLAQTNIDHRQLKRRSFHNSAARVSNQHRQILKQAQIRAVLNVGDKYRISPVLDKRLYSVSQFTAAGISIGADENQRLRDMSQPGE